MNLLRDKREDERPVEAAPDGRLSDDQFQQAGSGVDEKPVVKKGKSSSNTISTLLIAAAIFVIAILITYFGFYKQKVGNLTVADKASSTQVDSTGESGAAISDDTEVDAAQPGAVSTDTQITGESSLSIASDVMQNMQRGIGAGRVTAFSLDDASFSAEVAAGTVDGAQAVYNSIGSSLPAGAKLMSAQPKDSHALIMGSLNTLSSSEPTGLAKTDIDNELRQSAANAGTDVLSLNIDAPANEQAFIVLRISGTFEACQMFVAKLADKNWNVSISRMILMPGSGDAYTFVLRFYM